MRTSSVPDHVLATLTARSPLTSTQLATATRHPRPTVERALRALLATGRVRRTGCGTRGHPHKWSPPAKSVSAPRKRKPPAKTLRKLRARLDTTTARLLTAALQPPQRPNPSPRRHAVRPPNGARPMTDPP